MTEAMISYCGYNCHLCAARSDDRAVRQRMVDGWRKIMGYENYTADNVHCVGCRQEGHHADASCQARPCVIQRGLESCAHCDEFACHKLDDLLGSREHMLISHHRTMEGVTEEEYKLCLRQFESMPNIVRALAEAGKLPAWVIQGTDTEGA